MIDVFIISGKYSFKVVILNDIVVIEFKVFKFVNFKQLFMDIRKLIRD